MLIGGLQKFSLTDYPGKVSAIIYTQGCNFRCGFCYNPALISCKPPCLPAGRSAVSSDFSEESVFEFLKSRIGKLDAVVVTGGEPTIHDDLPGLIKKIKELGFLVGLYTNGTRPEMLKELINGDLISFVSMDVKTQLSAISYKLATGVEITDNDLDKIKESVVLLKNSNIDYRIATTVAPGLVTLDDVRILASQIRGARSFLIQPLVKTEEMLDNKYKDVESYPIEELERLRDEIAGNFGKCSIRN